MLQNVACTSYTSRRPARPGVNGSGARGGGEEEEEEREKQGEVGAPVLG